jgi:predicted acyltransferase
VTGGWAEEDTCRPCLALGLALLGLSVEALGWTWTVCFVKPIGKSPLHNPHL